MASSNRRGSMGFGTLREPTTGKKRTTKIDTSVEKSKTIERTTAFRADPVALSRMLALKLNQVRDYEPGDSGMGADESDLELELDDMDAYDDMEGDDEHEPTSAGTNYFLSLDQELGADALQIHPNPRLNLDEVYVLRVWDQPECGQPRCRFIPPAWFSRVPRTERVKLIEPVTIALEAIAALLERDLPSFLEDPSPRSFFNDERRHLKRPVIRPSRAKKKSYRTVDSLLSRAGLARRALDIVGSKRRVNEDNVKDIVPLVWITWPRLAAPLTYLQDNRFCAEVAAQLCLDGREKWSPEHLRAATASQIDVDTLLNMEVDSHTRSERFRYAIFAAGLASDKALVSALQSRLASTVEPEESAS